MEKSWNRIQLVDADRDWDDVTRWDALHDLPSPCDRGNAHQGEVIIDDCHETMVVNRSEGVVAVHGVDNVTGRDRGRGARVPQG